MYIYFQQYQWNPKHPSSGVCVRVNASKMGVFQKRQLCQFVDYIFKTSFILFLARLLFRICPLNHNSWIICCSSNWGCVFSELLFIAFAVLYCLVRRETDWSSAQAKNSVCVCLRLNMSMFLLWFVIEACCLYTSRCVVYCLRYKACFSVHLWLCTKLCVYESKASISFRDPFLWLVF